IGYLRVIHAAPDAPPVDIYVDTANLASNIGFQEASGRTNVIAGDYAVFITDRGVSPTDKTIVQLPVSLKVGQSLILVLGGVTDAITLTSYEESTEPLEENQSRVNFIHAVPFAPTVKAQVNNIDLSPLFDFGKESGGIVVSSGHSSMTFASSEQVLATYNADLFPHTNYTLVMTGRSNSLTQLNVLAFNNQVSGLTMMRVINMAPVSIDMYIDGVVLAQDVAYATAGEWLKRSDGTHFVSVFEAGADPNTAVPLLKDEQVNVVAGDDLSLIALGKTDDLHLLPFKEDLSPLPPNTARIAYINAWSDVPVAQVGNGSSVRPDIGRVGFAQGSQFFPMDVGTYRIFWARDDDTGGFVEVVDYFEIQPGLVYLYMLTGNSENPIVLTEAVPTAQEVANLPTEEGTGAGVNPEATKRPVTRLRMVNALDESVTIDVLVNGSPVATGLAYGQGGLFTDVPTGTFTVMIQQTGSSTPIATYDYRLTELADYSVFVYGPSYDPQLKAFDDQLVVFDPEFTTLRLINLSREEGLSVGLVEADATDPNSTQAGTIPGTNSSAPMIPLGTQYIVRSVEPLQASSLVSTVPGLHDLIVSDNRTDLLAQRIRSFNFELAVHYDVVIIYPPAINAIQVFLLRYPK
ncbi:MAG TPA: DUF4397 domain-containing protein, partial [Phototrophicaceae bacterium]|nr:DUF4397 domain-containing protein [Phototrophicaceae bacterium]